MTRSEALANHRTMWGWIASETRRQGRPVTKEDVIRAQKNGSADTRLDDCLNDCWLCGYTADEDRRPDCGKCPVIWQRTYLADGNRRSYSTHEGDICWSENVVYDIWLKAKDLYQAIKKAVKPPYLELVAAAELTGTPVTAPASDIMKNLTDLCAELAEKIARLDEKPEKQQEGQI